MKEWSNEEKKKRTRKVFSCYRKYNLCRCSNKHCVSRNFFWLSLSLSLLLRNIFSSWFWRFHIFFMFDIHAGFYYAQFFFYFRWIYGHSIHLFFFLFDFLLFSMGIYWIDIKNIFMIIYLFIFSSLSCLLWV